MPVNDQHPWSTADPAGDAGGIEELGRGLASVSEDPSLHVQRLEEARDLIERSEDPATAPHGPGGRIELVESDAGNVVAVIAGELVCRTDELAMVSDVLSGLGAEVRDELTSDTTGLTLLRLAGDAPVSRVVEACIVAGATAGPNEVTIEGGGWRLKALSSPEPTSRGLGRRPEHGPGAGVTVGVIDGGFTPDPGLRDDGWLDAVVGPDAPIDPLDGDAVPGLDAGSGHGTFVTGIVRQVAPGCMVRQYRAVGTLGLGNSWALMAAVTRAAADGCDIVNLSLGFEAVGNLGSLAVTAAVQAIAPQVLVVAAAGNGGGTTPTYPAAQKGVVAVGALRGDLGPTTWSNRGPWVDFSCVGEGVVSTFVDGTEEATAKPTATTFSGPDPIALWSGTSFAAPQVGGRLAALLSEGLGPLDAVEALRAESRSDTGGVPDPSFGYRLRILWGAVVGPTESLSPPVSIGCALMSEGGFRSDPGPEEVAGLVTRATAGDRLAWDALVERFAPLVFAVCRGFRLSPADASDVSQTVWLRLAENVGRLSQPERVGAWLVTTAKRECLAQQRARARFDPIDVDLDLRESPSPQDGPEGAALRLETVSEMAEAFALLAERCRDLLRRLVADRTESYREISEATGMPVGAIGPTRARCLEQLRRNLEVVGHAV